VELPRLRRRKKEEPIVLAPPPDAKPMAAPKERGRLLARTKPEAPIVEYDPAVHGSLVDRELPGEYDLIQQYWVDEGCSQVNIVFNRRTKQEEYILYEPTLTPFEYELIERVFEDLRDVLILTDAEVDEDKRILLFRKMEGLFEEYGIRLEQIPLFKLRYFLIRNFIGWSRLEPLMKDPNIEDISCDGNEVPIFLYHRKYRNIRTNIRFDEEALISLAIKLAQRSGKHVSIGNPMIDATLPDGSRLQLTLGKEVTTRGTSFTIRKFREEPFTPIELMEHHTFNPEALVYFWFAIENNKSLVFIGGTASGKTTSLNAVSLFITPLAKVISIEDTREVTLYHDNWIASVTRESVAEAGATIDMFALLKSAMRQRPEYILVGEVRGHEAQTLFQAMNTGHTTFSTMHAGSVDAAIHRLESEPLNVPRNMLQALNIISIQALIYQGSARVRRCQEIVEVIGIDPSTGNLRVNNVFTYDPVRDLLNYTGRSQVYASITEKRGWTREQLDAEIAVRKRLLIAMHEQRIRDYKSVSRLFQSYYIDSASVMEHLDDLRQAIV
jgi:archaeal flagellar protein FlaI